MTHAEDIKNNKWYIKFNPGWFALILSIIAIIFAFGLSSARVDHVVVKVDGIVVAAAETRKIVDINSNRLTTLEQFNRTLCDDISEIKKDIKDMRSEQLSFYRSYNKANGKK